jgi:hypothetical protein
MQRLSNKLPALVLFLLFGLILLASYLFKTYCPGWTFSSGRVVLASQVIVYFSFFGFILSCVRLLSSSGCLLGTLGIVFFFFFSVGSCLAIFPIDTTTQPMNKAILGQNPDGTTRVLRAYKNAKTNQRIEDTAVVRDVFVFRKIIHISPASETER